MSVVHVSKTTIRGSQNGGKGFRAGNGSVSGTEVNISAGMIDKVLTIKADADNSESILIGPPGSASTGFVLRAGESVDIPVEDSASVAIISASGTQQFSWLAL